MLIIANNSLGDATKTLLKDAAEFHLGADIKIVYTEKENSVIAVILPKTTDDHSRFEMFRNVVYQQAGFPKLAVFHGELKPTTKIVVSHIGEACLKDYAGDKVEHKEYADGNHKSIILFGYPPELEAATKSFFEGKQILVILCEALS